MMSALVRGGDDGCDLDAGGGLSCILTRLSLSDVEEEDFLSSLCIMEATVFFDFCDSLYERIVFGALPCLAEVSSAALSTLLNSSSKS